MLLLVEFQYVVEDRYPSPGADAADEPMPIYLSGCIEFDNGATSEVLILPGRSTSAPPKGCEIPGGGAYESPPGLLISNMCGLTPGFP
jgi:hypothetical protein